MKWLMTILEKITSISFLLTGKGCALAPGYLLVQQHRERDTNTNKVILLGDAGDVSKGI